MVESDLRQDHIVDEALSRLGGLLYMSNGVQVPLGGLHVNREIKGLVSYSLELLEAWQHAFEGPALLAESLVKPLQVHFKVLHLVYKWLDRFRQLTVVLSLKLQRHRSESLFALSRRERHDVGVDLVGLESLELPLERLGVTR